MKNLNQEITRNNIINMRKSHKYSQRQLAELVGVSRTTYNGIENGKVKITIFYVELLAKFYNVPIEKIAVISGSYDEGFYHGMQAQKKIDDSEFDSQNMKIYQTEKELLSGEKTESTLYHALKSMGYTLDIIDLNECDPAIIPSDILKSCDSGKIFVLKKEKNFVAYWSPDDFCKFEHFIMTSINGYLSELAQKTYEASENPKSKDFVFIDGKRVAFRRNSTTFNPNTQTKKLFKTDSKKEKYFERKNINELKDNLKIYGIKNDEDSKK